MSTLGEFICKVFEKVTETELSGRSCFSLFGEVELPECLKEDTEGMQSIIIKADIESTHEPEYELLKERVATSL